LLAAISARSFLLRVVSTLPCCRQLCAALGVFAAPHYEGCPKNTHVRIKTSARITFVIKATVPKNEKTSLYFFPLLIKSQKDKK
jgi:hypothetical protein